MEVGTQSATVPPAMDAYKGAFHAIGRLFHACSTGWQPSGLEASDADAVVAMVGHEGVSDRRQLVLADLADGPYYIIAMQLGAEDLSRADCACRLTRDLNRSNGGPWMALGRSAFLGLELDGDSIFDPSADPGAEPPAAAVPTTAGGALAGPAATTAAPAAAIVRPAGGGSRKSLRVDWKCRYMRFASEVKMFRSPFNGSEITTVQQADEIAYSRCKLRTDVLEANSEVGVYLEVQVLANPDNVSLAVVDFEAGGCSSVTFSPDTGAVIRERKIREAPRKVEGTYIQPLSTITSGQGFEGSMGLYLQGGRLAFFRKHVDRSATEKGAPEGEWECTGFVTDLSWAEGRRLTPCLAFRDVGDYHLRTMRIDASPPIALKTDKLAYEDSLWRSLDWDAGEQDAVEM